MFQTSLAEATGTEKVFAERSWSRDKQGIGKDWSNPVSVLSGHASALDHCDSSSIVPATIELREPSCAETVEGCLAVFLQ
jgi:hypothetical protein